MFAKAPADSAKSQKEREKARELRRSQWWKQTIAKGLCYYCGGQFPADELTMDHKIPIARGGRSNKGNLVPCCKDCNSKKKYHTPVEMILDSLGDSVK